MAETHPRGRFAGGGFLSPRGAFPGRKSGFGENPSPHAAFRLAGSCPESLEAVERKGQLPLANVFEHTQVFAAGKT